MMLSLILLGIVMILFKMWLGSFIYLGYLFWKNTDNSIVLHQNRPQNHWTSLTFTDKNSIKWQSKYTDCSQGRRFSQTIPILLVKNDGCV